MVTRVSGSQITISHNSQTTTANSTTILTQGLSHPSATGNNIIFDSSGRVNVPSQPYAYGDVGINNSAGVRNLTVTASQGFTFNASTDRLTALIAGTYMMHCHQLVDTNANGWYLQVRVNGSLIKYGYVTGSQVTKDCEISCVYNLAVNDYIDFYVSASATTTWGHPHSNFFVFKIN